MKRLAPAWIMALALCCLRAPAQTTTGTMDAGTVTDLTLYAVGTNNGTAIVEQTGGAIGTIREDYLHDVDAAGPSVGLSGTATNIVVQDDKPAMPLP